VERQRRVREAFAHAWFGYKSYAWGKDELEAVSATGVVSYGMGLTLVDSLDTLLLMGFDTDATQAVDWIERSLTFGNQEDINLFEVTIRVIGGLLTTYEATGNQVVLQKAEQLASRMLFSFHTPHGLPYGTLGLRSRKRYNPAWSGGSSTIAEVATLQLEFRALSYHTGNPVYDTYAQRIIDHLRRMATTSTWPADLPHGLYPMFISPESGLFTSTEVTLGARADSLYEYLLKLWLMSSKTDHRIRAMYDTSVRAIRKHLVRVGGASRCSNCTYVATWNYKTRVYKEQMDHLVCFLPGMLALGVHGETHDADMALAKELMETCYRMYSDSPSGLAPEIASFGDRTKVVADQGARHNLLRPETVESLFLLWRQTGDERYRDYGWNIFQAIETHTRVPSGGFAPIKDVTVRAPLKDRHRPMESFFTAETLKYLYLLFGDGSQYPLDEYVLNTEAHPLRIRPEYAWGEMWGSLPAVDELDTFAPPSLSRAIYHEAARGNATAAAQAQAALSAQHTHDLLRARVKARAAELAQIPTRHSP